MPIGPGLRPTFSSSHPGSFRKNSSIELTKMARKRSTTIAEYIRAAPREGQPHLRRLYAILKSIAPEAKEAIKWGIPFFVEPRFLFAFSAHRAHLNFAPLAAGLEPFRGEIGKHKASKNFLQHCYERSLPA